MVIAALVVYTASQQRRELSCYCSDLSDRALLLFSLVHPIRRLLLLRRQQRGASLRSGLSFLRGLHMHFKLLLSLAAQPKVVALRLEISNDLRKFAEEQSKHWTSQRHRPAPNADVHSVQLQDLIREHRH